LTEAQEQLGTLEKSAPTKKNRLSLLTEMEREFDGFARSVKEIMLQREKRALKGDRRTGFADDSGGGRGSHAIEVALGAGLQNIIVGTDEDGKAAISFLKATITAGPLFCRFSSIRENRAKDGDITGQEGFVGVASQPGCL
jgi:chromosome segregation protein